MGDLETKWPNATKGVYFSALLDKLQDEYDALVGSGIQPVPSPENAELMADAQSVIVDESVHRLNTSHDIMLTGSDPANGGLTFSIVDWPKFGTPWTNSNEPQWVGYAPNPGYTGSDSFTFTVTNQDGVTSQPATIEITVQPVSDHGILWANAAYNIGHREDGLREAS